MRGLQIPIALLALAGTLQLASAQAAGEAPPNLINPNPLSSLQLESLTATRSLPLFTPSRTAPVIEAFVEEVAVAPVEPQADPEAPPPDLQLIGIVLADSSQTALLRNPITGEVVRLASGEEFDNWALNIVDARSVELRQGDRVQGLKMFETFPAPPPSGQMMGLPGEAFDVDGNPIPQEPYLMEETTDPFAPLTDAPPPEPEPLPAEEFPPELSNQPIPEEGALPAAREVIP